MEAVQRRNSRHLDFHRGPEVEAVTGSRGQLADNKKVTEVCSEDLAAKQEFNRTKLPGTALRLPATQM